MKKPLSEGFSEVCKSRAAKKHAEMTLSVGTQTIRPLVVLMESQPWPNSAASKKPSPKRQRRNSKARPGFERFAHVNWVVLHRGSWRSPR
jgi:hypothetical protein